MTVTSPRLGVRRNRGSTSYMPSMYAGTIGAPASIASTAAPFRKVPMAPVTESRPSGKMTTDHRSRSIPFKVSR